MANTFINLSLFITLICIVLMAMKIYADYKEIEEIKECNKELRFDSQEDCLKISQMHTTIKKIRQVLDSNDYGNKELKTNKIKEILTDYQSH